MNLNYFDKQWTAMCPPAAFFPILMSAVILFDVYSGRYRRAGSNVVVALLGTVLLWVLCAAKMEFVAYALYFIPILFFIFFMAVLVYDRAEHAIKDEYIDENGCNSCENKPSTGCCRK